MQAEKSNNRKDDQHNHDQLQFSARWFFEFSVGVFCLAGLT
jgi:hypothetical protein